MKALDTLALRLGVNGDLADWLTAHAEQLRTLVLADAAEIPDMPFGGQIVAQLRGAVRQLEDAAALHDHWAPLVAKRRAEQAEAARLKAEAEAQRAVEVRKQQLLDHVKAQRDLVREARELGLDLTEKP